MNTIHLEAKTKERILATALHGPEGKGLISGYWEPRLIRCTVAHMPEVGRAVRQLLLSNPTIRAIQTKRKA